MVTSDHMIRDRDGVAYLVHSERGNLWTFDLSLGADVVGYVWCIEQSPVLQISDLKLYDRVPVPETVIAACWRKVLRRSKPVRNHRNRGLGTAILALLSQLATSAGFLTLEGWISDVDSRDNPVLLEWYRRRGFIVTDGPKKYPHQVATIRKHL